MVKPTLDITVHLLYLIAFVAAIGLGLSTWVWPDLLFAIPCAVIVLWAVMEADNALRTRR